MIHTVNFMKHLAQWYICLLYTSSQKLTNQWLQKYKGVMKICNYTVGQADSDNTWASMQDNGSHIISFNISLVDPADRDITLETVCEEMREDLKAYPEFSKAQVIFGGSNTGMSAQASADFEVYGYRDVYKRQAHA